MKRFTHYRDLYYHILKCFYLGQYKQGDRFPTQVELASRYKVAANSVKKVFKLLLEDGFIVTDRSFGTHVTFNADDPAHLAKVPLFHHNPQDNHCDTLILPSRFLAYSICHGLKIASERQLKSYLELAGMQLKQLQDYPERLLANDEPLLGICRGIGNRYITEFVDLLASDYLFMDRKELSNSDTIQAINAYALEFYREFCDLLREKQYDRAIPLFCRFYQQLYRLPGLMVFARLEYKHKVFASQSLYAQLMHRLFLSIVVSDMKKGDMLPTESELAHRYGVSLITVRKAAAVLKEIGLIDGKRFVGTCLLEDWNAPAVQQWMSSLIEDQCQMIADCIFAEYVVGRALCDCMASLAPPRLADEMQSRLDAQWEAYRSCSAPLFMSEVFLAPLVDYINSPLLTTCFYHVHDDLTKFLAIRLLQMSKGFRGSDRVFAYATRAIEALRQGDGKAFVASVDAATLLNWELLRGVIDQTVYRCVKGSSL